MERYPRPTCLVPLALLALGALVGGAFALAAVAAGLVPGLGPRGAGPQAEAAIPPPVERRYVRELPLPLPDTGSESADIILTTTGYTGDQARTTVLYLEGDTRRVRWESPQLSEATYLLQLAADAQHVYLADQTRLLALRRSDGSVA